MKSIIRRILSLVLVMAMCFTLLPEITPHVEAYGEHTSSATINIGSGGPVASMTCNYYVLTNEEAVSVSPAVYAMRGWTQYDNGPSEYCTSIKTVTIPADGNNHTFNFTSDPSTSNAYGAVNGYVIVRKITFVDGTYLNAADIPYPYAYTLSEPSTVIAQAPGVENGALILSTFMTTALGYNKTLYTLDGQGYLPNTYMASILYLAASTRNGDSDRYPVEIFTYNAMKTTVAYNQEGGSNGTTSQDVTWNTTPSGITVPTRSGYKFMGYYSKENGAGTQFVNASGAWTRTADATLAPLNTWFQNPVTLYAYWVDTSTPYTVTYDMQGGTGGTGSQSVTYDSTPSNITVPTRTGYTFGGYYTATSGGGTQYVNESGGWTRKVDFTGAKTLYAKWTAKSGLPITYYDTNGTTTLNSGTYTFGGTVAAYVPTKTNYTFKGWATSAANAAAGTVALASGTGLGSGTESYQTSNSALLIKLYASWTPNLFPVDGVSYDPNGGKWSDQSTAPKSLSGNKPSSTTVAEGAPETPTKDGYTFAFWSAAATSTINLSAESLKTQVTAGTTKFYAQWTPNTTGSNKITYAPGTGSVQTANVDKTYTSSPYTAETYDTLAFTAAAGYEASNKFVPSADVYDITQGKKISANSTTDFIAAGDQFVPIANGSTLTLTAQWEPLKIIVNTVAEFGGIQVQQPSGTPIADENGNSQFASYHNNIKIPMEGIFYVRLTANDGYKLSGVTVNGVKKSYRRDANGYYLNMSGVRGETYNIYATYVPIDPEAGQYKVEATILGGKGQVGIADTLEGVPTVIAQMQNSTDTGYGKSALASQSVTRYLQVSPYDPQTVDGAIYKISNLMIATQINGKTTDLKTVDLTDNNGYYEVALPYSGDSDAAHGITYKVYATFALDANATYYVGTTASNGTVTIGGASYDVSGGWSSAAKYGVLNGDNVNLKVTASNGYTFKSATADKVHADTGDLYANTTTDLNLLAGGSLMLHIDAANYKVNVIFGVSGVHATDFTADKDKFSNDNQDYLVALGNAYGTIDGAYADATVTAAIGTTPNADGTIPVTYTAVFPDGTTATQTVNATVKDNVVVGPENPGDKTDPKDTYIVPPADVVPGKNTTPVVVVDENGQTVDPSNYTLTATGPNGEQLAVTDGCIEIPTTLNPGDKITITATPTDPTKYNPSTADVPVTSDGAPADYKNGLEAAVNDASANQSELTAANTSDTDLAAKLTTMTSPSAAYYKDGAVISGATIAADTNSDAFKALKADLTSGNVTLTVSGTNSKSSVSVFTATYDDGVLDNSDHTANFVTIIPGDVNRNGIVRANDANNVISYSVGTDVSAISSMKYFEQLADVNGNGTIRANDGYVIISMSVGTQASN
jgi:uncharacterized repeat protein (TIGR02543 family)